MGKLRFVAGAALALGIVLGADGAAHGFEFVDTVRSWFGGVLVDRDGGRTTLRNGREVFAGRESAPVESTLRVYGAQKPPSIPFGPKGPLGVITHLLVTQPMDRNERLYRELGCEAGAAQDATIIQVLAREAALEEAIEGLAPESQRVCARLTGSVFTLEEYSRGGEAQPMDWQIQAGLQVDANKILILSAVREVACQ